MDISQYSPQQYQNRIHYIDRLHVRVKRNSRALVSLIEDLKIYCFKVTKEEYKKHRVPYLHISRPEPQAFQILCGSKDVVNVMYIEMALDLLTQTRSDAEALHEWLDRHLLERWPGKKSATVVVDMETKARTTYSGRRSAANVTAIYSGKPSKVTREPCCHIERRVRGKKRIIAARLSLCDLANMGVADYKHWWDRQWDKKLMLRTISPQRLVSSYLGEKRTVGRPKKARDSLPQRRDSSVLSNYNSNWPQRAAYLLIRNAEYQHGFDYVRYGYIRDGIKRYRDMKADGELFGLTNLQHITEILSRAYGLKKDDFLDDFL